MFEPIYDGRKQGTGQENKGQVDCHSAATANKPE